MTLHFFTGGGHVAQLIHHQPRHGGVIVAFQRNVHFPGNLRQLGMPGEDVGGRRLLDDVARVGLHFIADFSHDLLPPGPQW